MPKEDVIDVLAVGEGLCVHNLFQTNMVLQRDKPVSIWGWADPGEKVTVSFASQTQTATADKDRAWKVTLAAMPAKSVPKGNEPEANASRKTRGPASGTTEGKTETSVHGNRCCSKGCVRYPVNTTVSARRYS